VGGRVNRLRRTSRTVGRLGPHGGGNREVNKSSNVILRVTDGIVTANL
jgi:hypothetical protein